MLSGGREKVSSPAVAGLTKFRTVSLTNRLFPLVGDRVGKARYAFSHEFQVSGTYERKPCDFSPEYRNTGEKEWGEYCISPEKRLYIWKDWHDRLILNQSLRVHNEGLLQENPPSKKKPSFGIRGILASRRFHIFP